MNTLKAFILFFSLSQIPLKTQNHVVFLQGFSSLTLTDPADYQRNLQLALASYLRNKLWKKDLCNQLNQRETKTRKKYQYEKSIRHRQCIS